MQTWGIPVERQQAYDTSGRCEQGRANSGTLQCVMQPVRTKSASLLSEEAKTISHGQMYRVIPKSLC